VIGLSLGAAVLTVTTGLARRGLGSTESRVFRWPNELPDEGYRAVWFPMQYGTFGTVPALSAVALLKGRFTLAGAIAAAGTGAWVLAKAIKRPVGRGRPAALLPHVRLRGKEEGDLGFPSGHAAVSAALTAVVWPYVPAPWRVPLTALAGFVPVARLYVGAHLPLDVVGGSALGVAIGSLTNLLLPTPGPFSPSPIP